MKTKEKAMNRIVVITGATSGLGKAFLESYIKQGDQVVAVGRNREKCQQIQKEIGEKTEVQFCVVDLEKEKAEIEIYEFVKQRYGRIDILINNAGFGMVEEYLDGDMQVQDAMIKVNIVAVNRFSYLFGNMMKKQKSGLIINIASTGAYHPGPYTAEYYATKAYVASFSEALQIELEKYGVQVVSVCPGALATEFSKKAGRKENPFAMSPQRVIRSTLLGIRRRKAVVVPGIFYKVFIRIPRNIGKKLIGRQQKNMALNIDK